MVVLQRGTIHDSRHAAVASGLLRTRPHSKPRLAGHSSVAFCLDRDGHLFPAALEPVAARPDNPVEHGPQTQPDGGRTKSCST